MFNVNAIKVNDNAIKALHVETRHVIETPSRKKVLVHVIALLWKVFETRAVVEREETIDQISVVFEDGDQRVEIHKGGRKVLNVSFDGTEKGLLDVLNGYLVEIAPCFNV